MELFEEIEASRKRYTAERIIGLLREAEVRLSHGERLGEICRGLGVSEHSYHRWRRESMAAWRRAKPTG